MGRPPRKRGKGKGNGGDDENNVYNLTMPGFEPLEPPEEEEPQRKSLVHFKERKRCAVRRQEVKISDKDVVDFFIEAVAGGMPKGLAAAEAGVNENTIARWLDEGSKHDPATGADCPYGAFYTRYQQARAHRLWALLEALPLDDPRAIMFLLKGEFPEIYGGTPKVQVAATQTVNASASAEASTPRGINEGQREFIVRKLLGIGHGGDGG